MKKILCLIFCMVLMMSLAACGGDKEEDTTAAYTYEIGLLTASPEISIDDEDRVEATWEGVREFAEEEGKTYKYYEAAANDTKSQLSRIEDAVSEGVKVLIAVGPEVNGAIAEAQKKHDDVTFIYLDGTLNEIAENCVNVDFDEKQAGFLAGYSAVLEGFYNMAYLANGESEEAADYGYGFLQGANQAAMNFSRYSEIRYDYGQADAGEDAIRAKAKKWYDEGALAVFTYGGDVFDAVKAEAEKADKKVIASNASKGYCETVITSAKKCYEDAVAAQLEAVYSSSFQGGKSVKMDAENKGIGLDMKKSKFQYFNESLYDDIYKKLASGEQKILSAKEAKTIDDLVKEQWMYYIRIEQE